MRVQEHMRSEICDSCLGTLPVPTEKIRNVGVQVWVQRIPKSLYCDKIIREESSSLAFTHTIIKKTLNKWPIAYKFTNRDALFENIISLIVAQLVVFAVVS